MYNLDFGAALVAMKEGKKVARTGWNGKGMCAFLVQGSKFTTNREPLISVLGANVEVNYRPHLDLLAADGSVGTWSPSNSDILAEDWYVLGDMTV